MTGYPVTLTQVWNMKQMTASFSGMASGPEETLKVRRFERLPKLLWLVATAWLLHGCGAEDGQQQTPPPPAVTVARPLVETVTDWDEYTGRFGAVDSVELRARVSGYLESIHFREGAIVSKGDLLFIIDPRPYEATLAEAKALLSAAKVRLDLSRSDLDRAQRLFKSRAISEEELDSRTQQKKEAEAAVLSAEAAVQSAQLNVEFTHVKAPVSGRIGRALVTDGNLVSGGSEGSTLLTTLVSIDPVYLYMTADERSVLKYLRLDQQGERTSARSGRVKVRARLADEDQFGHVGYVDFVDNQIDQATGTLQARAVFDNPDGLLLPGMFARVQVMGKGDVESLMIPETAIANDLAEEFVWVLDEQDQAQRRRIVAGRLHDGLRVIREGLQPEDRVVINGTQRVQPGVKVKAQLTELKPSGKVGVTPAGGPAVGSSEAASSESDGQ